MPAALDRYYTKDEVLAFPRDGNRYEAVYGELLVTPSPMVAHQVVVGRLFVRLFHYVESHGLGRVFASPADLSWGRDDVLVQPDLFVVAPEDARAPHWSAMRHLTLVVEVLSPSSARFDRFAKRRLYQEMQVPAYWVVDLGDRRIEVWTPSVARPNYAEQELAWHPNGAPAPLTLQVAELFAP